MGSFSSKPKDKTVCNAKFRRNTLGCTDKLEHSMRFGIPPTYTSKMRSNMAHAIIKKYDACNVDNLDQHEECMRGLNPLSMSQAREVRWLDKLGIMHPHHAPRTMRKLIIESERKRGTKDLKARRAYNKVLREYVKKM